MDSEGIGDRNSTGSLNCPSSGMATTSIPYHSVEGLSICSESMNGIDPFHCPGWDHIISGNQVGKFGDLVLGSEFVHSHYPGVVENQAPSSHLVHFPPDSDLADLLPKIPCFGNSFGQMNEAGCPSNFPPNQGIANDVDCQKKHQENSCGVMGTSPNGKRKRKNVEEKQKDPIGNPGGILSEDDDKKNIGSNSRGRQGVRQQSKDKEKDNSTGAEPCKETYIHVRAKRGQATNSHSLAERVRRERISERMRMLQELVPGCNKITGKAVMLDEIINYVQSLQQQVEFLSMKLATVNPELNLDIQQILSKDINLLHSRPHNNMNAPPGLGLSHPFTDLPQGIVNGLPGATAQPFQAHPLPQNLWNNELQSVLQMGFQNLGPNGE